MSLRFVSLFAGIEAASAAWEPLGWHCVGVSEIDPLGCAVLARQYPRTPNLGDVTKITREQIAQLGQFDVIVFGSPCQDLSLSGSRRGLAGERSRLFHDAMQVVEWARVHCGVRFALWENVPGALSSNDGADFGAVVAAMAGVERVDVPPAGWGGEGAAVGDKGMVEWSTLDAQWFGTPMLRRRLFALVDFGNWRDRPPILLEPASVRGCDAPCAGSRKNTAADLASGVAPGDQAGRLVCVSNGEGTLGAPYLTVSNIAKNVNNQTPLLVFQRGEQFEVRRFTVVECERLQGFPDNHTRVPGAGALATDNPRFRALGNTMCVHVMRWIGRSIEFAALYF